VTPSITNVTAIWRSALPGVQMVSAVMSTAALMVICQPRDAFNRVRLSFAVHFAKLVVTPLTFRPKSPVIFAERVQDRYFAAANEPKLWFGVAAAKATAAVAGDRWLTCPA
jgi:hypothetical protein